VATGICLKKL